MTFQPRVLVVTNFCTHYRAPLFELLHKRLGAEFVFFSEGTESYWQSHLGVTSGSFPYKTVTGDVHLGSQYRLNTALARELWKREFDVMIKCMNGRVELPSAFAVAQAKRHPFVLWTGMWMHPHTFFHQLSHPVTRAIYRNSDAIITYGHHVSRFVVAEGAEPAKVFTAENATNLSLFGREVSAEEVAGVRSRYELGESPLVLAVSRLVAEKGLEYLIEAVGMLSLPRPILAVVGTGDLAQSLSALAASHGVDLRLLGGMKPDELAPIYAASTVFVIPSVTTSTFKEPWGLACNEAMSQGIPVIATDAVGAAAGGLVVDRRTGLVVPERDASVLAAAIQALLADPKWAAQIGSRGRARVRDTNFSNMATGFERAVAHALNHYRVRRKARRRAKAG